MKVRFWGVRGSFATPGQHFLRYGGNTTAIEVQAESGKRILFDVGTGATQFGSELMRGEFGKGQGELTILITHTHIDHLQGLPFFVPFFIKGNSIQILGQSPPGSSLSEVLQNQLNPHYSPLYGLENLAAGVSVDTIDAGTLNVDGFDVMARELPHGSMQVLGFRVTADNKTVALLTDVEYPNATPTPEALELAKDADLLIHDGMFTDFEYSTRKGWGHSPISSAIAVAETAGAKKLALFHHNPDATDAEIDAIAEEAQRRANIPVFAASESAPPLEL